MTWHWLLAVLLGLSVEISLSPRASFAQRPPQSRGPDANPPPLAAEQEFNVELFDTAGYIRFQLVQGRLVLDPPRHRQGSEQSRHNGVYESLTVNAQRGVPSLHYICQTDTQRWLLSVTDAQQTDIESAIEATGELSKLHQPCRGMLQWEVQRGDLKQSFQAPTLLHLRQQNPIDFDRHYAVLIKRALRGQCLAEIADKTDQSLLSLAIASNLPTIQQVRQCIEQLGHRHRSERVAAKQQLLAWGTVVLPLVQRIGDSDLDAEQRSQIRDIETRLIGLADDTPASLAQLLLSDHDYWAGLAPRLPATVLADANRHLENIGLPLLVDSQSPERIATVPR